LHLVTRVVDGRRIARGDARIRAVRIDLQGHSAATASRRAGRAVTAAVLSEQSRYTAVAAIARADESAAVKPARRWLDSITTIAASTWRVGGAAIGASSPATAGCCDCTARGAGFAARAGLAAQRAATGQYRAATER